MSGFASNFIEREYAYRITIQNEILKWSDATAARTHQKFRKLTWAALTQLCYGDLLLLFQNHSIFLLGVFGLQSLPWQASFQEINQDISDALQVVSATLLYAEVIVY
jgi:hypothetical protein